MHSQYTPQYTQTDLRMPFNALQCGYSKGFSSNPPLEFHPSHVSCKTPLPHSTALQIPPTPCTKSHVFALTVHTVVHTMQVLCRVAGGVA
jgi:hypothetical protein